MGDWMTVEQVAETFGLNPGSVLNAIYHHRVQAQRVSGRWLVASGSARDRWRGILLHERGLRQCSACELVLPLSEFHSYKGWMRRRTCKTCWRQKQRTYLTAWRRARKDGN